jgi:MFS family permease
MNENAIYGFGSSSYLYRALLCSLRWIWYILLVQALDFILLIVLVFQGGIGTAAPTIVHDLSGKDFSWVSAAYTLASSSFIPLSGNMAQVFGRRPILLGAIIVFAVGSAVSGSARNMDSLIVGRGQSFAD